MLENLPMILPRYMRWSPKIAERCPMPRPGSAAVKRFVERPDLRL